MNNNNNGKISMKVSIEIEFLPVHVCEIIVPQYFTVFRI